jgi:hypothetical protein
MKFVVEWRNKMTENEIFNNLITNLNKHSLLDERGKKFIMNFNLFNLFKNLFLDVLPFNPETNREILKRKKIYGYYSRIPIVVDKNLLDNFLVIRILGRKDIVIDLTVSYKKEDVNKGIFLNSDFIEHIKNFHNIDVGMSVSDKRGNEYNLLLHTEDLLIGKLTLFGNDILEYFLPKSERIVWKFSSLTKEKFLKVLKEHNKHNYHIDVSPINNQIFLSCFDCKKMFITKTLLTKDVKNIKNKYHILFK